jgi:tetratricopeptide (TPR) repeat protein
VSAAVTIALFAALEIAVRVLGVEPRPWPTFDNPLDLPEIAIDPLLGAMARPGWKEPWHGLFQIEIDARGFRSTGLPPPANPRRRVVLIGDSCSFGFGVDTPDWFVTRLDERQRESGAGIELTSVAYQGYSAVAGQYVLRERGLPLRPDLVVIAFSANNAFRLSASTDAARFRFFAVRKLVLRSRALQIAASYLANRFRPAASPRDREHLVHAPLPSLRRIADIDDYTGALAAMARDSRAAGAEPVFLLIPRASEVSAEHAWEDAALSSPPTKDVAEMTQRELYSFEASCLDTRKIQGDPLDALRRAMPAWRPVFPRKDDVRAELVEGAKEYAAGHTDAALARFDRAAELDPGSPLAWYARGVAQLDSGATHQGIDALTHADALACNVFLHYQVAARETAERLGVRVVDVTLPFLARVGQSLYVDPAHPNPAGHAIIADALWPIVAPS